MMKKWLTLLAMTAGLVSTGNAADINRLKTFTGVASQWPWQLNTDGTWTSKQPAFSDLSGALASTQLPAFTGGDCISSAGTVALDCKATFAPKVDNNTELSALPYAYANAVIRLGYATAGDSPSVLFTRSNSACSLNAGAGDGGSQVPTSDGKCWLASLPAEVDARIFGVVGDGSTVNTTAFANAIAAISGALVIPAGTFKTDTIVVPKSLKINGAGVGVTIISPSSGANDTFQFKKVGGYISGTLSDLSIVYSGGTPTAGCGVNIGGGTPVGGVNVSRILINKTYHGVCVDQSTAGATSISDIDVTNIPGDGYKFVSTNTASLFRFSTYQSTVSGGVGIHVLGGQGIHIENGNTSLQANGVVIAPTTGVDIADVWLSNIDLDASTVGGLSIDCTGGGKVRNLHAVAVRTGFANDGTFTSGFGTAINGANCQGISLIGGEDVRNVREGLQVLGGSNIAIVGRLIQGNSVAGSGSYNAVNISGGDNVSITSSIIGGYTDGSANNQNYGIAVQSGFTGSAVFASNILTGNVGGAYINASASTTIYVRGNIGFTSPYDYPTGTSGTAIGRLDTNNAWAGTQTFNKPVTTGTDQSQYATVYGRYSSGYSGAVTNTDSASAFWEQQVNSIPAFRVDSKGSIITKGGTPTMGACGTSPPSPVGNDQAFAITTGTGTVTSCAVNFSQTKTSTPRCIPNVRTTGVSMALTPSTSGVTIAFGASFPSGVIDVVCLQ